MTVYIIILHYKNVEDTLLCLESVGKLNTNSLTSKVLLVNNSQNSKTKLKIKKFQIIHNQKNLGYAGGMNVGIEKALKDKTAEYVLILNNDTVVPPDLLSVLLKEKVDIVAPVIKFRSLDGKWIYDFGGRINWWTGRTKHIELSNYPIIQLSNKKIKKMISQPIDYISGCCMLVRKEVFENIGLFDESYFFYFEDVDFCTRAKRGGFKISVNPNVVVFHALSASIGRWSDRAIFYNLKSNFIFIIKHLGIRIPIGLFYLCILTLKIVLNRIRGL